jgi:transposase
MTFPQNSAGFAAFQQQLHQTSIAPGATLIVMEAIGSYWITLAVTLHEAGYVVSVVNPAQIHDYVKSLPLGAYRASDRLLAGCACMVTQ